MRCRAADRVERSGANEQVEVGAHRPERVVAGRPEFSTAWCVPGPAAPDRARPTECPAVAMESGHPDELKIQGWRQSAPGLAFGPDAVDETQCLEKGTPYCAGC